MPRPRKQNHLFIFEMQDCGKYSFERYYVLANSLTQAEKIFKETRESDRPYEVTEHTNGACICEVY